MKHIIFITISLLFFTNNILLSQGSHVGKETYKWLSELPKNEKSRSVLPISASLDDFTPNVIDQGQTGMCVSYALSTIHTIIYARNNNITDKEKIDKYRSSPTFLYYLVKNDKDTDCTSGLNELEGIVAWGFMALYGIPYSSDVEENYYHPFSNNMICEKYPYNNKDLINDIKEASNYRSKPNVACGEVKTIGRQEIMIVDHELVKSELAAGNPCYLAAVFSRDFFSKEKENCTSNPEGKSDGIGHAMVIVGYDDNKQSYKIMNSYGDEWGCDGYTWIKYEDLTLLDGMIVSFNGYESKKSKKDDISEFLVEIENNLNKNFNFRKNKEVEELVKENESDEMIEQVLEPCIELHKEQLKDFFSNSDILDAFCACNCALLILEYAINEQIGEETPTERIQEIWSECYKAVSTEE